MKISTWTAILACVVVPQVRGADWISAPSTYTHSPQTGQRVTQYAPPPTVYAPWSGDFVRSGYRHYRSTIRAGDSVDRLHTTEEWGRPVRPYGEWQRPFRPYSVPYPLWASPFAGRQGRGGVGAWGRGGAGEWRRGGSGPGDLPDVHDWVPRP